MIIVISGGSGGLGKYLESGQKQGMLDERDLIDERVLIDGHLSLFEETIKDYRWDDNADKYLHITLSFKEKDIDINNLKAITSEFKDYLFNAYEHDDFLFYAEAHLPKLKSFVDVDGIRQERYPHIHVAIPKVNLRTGKKENPLGFIKGNLKYIDAFQETINQKYKLASPKDNIRKEFTSKQDIINRYSINKETKKTVNKAFLIQQIRHEVAKKNIQSEKELFSHLGFLGEVKRIKGRNETYINFKSPSNKKGFNIKNIELLLDPTKEIKKNYDHWIKTKSFEVRFIEQTSKKVQLEYNSLTEFRKNKYLYNQIKSNQPNLKEQPILVENFSNLKGGMTQMPSNYYSAMENLYSKTAYQKSIKDWKKEIGEIDCRDFLNYLSHKYGLIQDDITIVKNNQGKDRIQTTDKMYTASDFLTKVMNINFSDAKGVLIDTIARQKESELYDYPKNVSKKLWAKFIAFKQSNSYSSLLEKLRADKENIKRDCAFYWNKQQPFLNNQVRKVTLQKKRVLAFAKVDKKFQEDLEDINQSNQTRYLQFLYLLANEKKGEATEEAIFELQRLSAQREEDIEDSAIVFKSKQIEASKHNYNSLSDTKIKVSKKGSVDFLNDNGDCLFRETKEKIIVFDKSEKNISTALLVAQYKFNYNTKIIIETPKLAEDKQVLDKVIKKLKLVDRVRINNKQKNAEIERLN